MPNFFQIIQLVVLLSAVYLFPSRLVGEWRDSSIALKWSTSTLQSVRDTKMGAPVAARALAIVHTCMYDAWAAYDDKAIGTQLGGILRRPGSERTQSNKERAISYAAYRALVDILPENTESVYRPLMRQLGYDPDDKSTDIETPTGVGNVACGAILEFRHHDGSNQLGDMASSSEGSSAKDVAASPYSDWTGYRPLNQPGTVPARFPFSKPLNPDHWQPLTPTLMGILSCRCLPGRNGAT